MKPILLSLLLIVLNAKNYNSTEFKVNTVNKKKISYMFKTYKRDTYISDLWGDTYRCKILNKSIYCIREDKKLLYIKSKYSNYKSYTEIYSYKTGKILREGYILSTENGDEAIGIWRIYNYKSGQIKYIT